MNWLKKLYSKFKNTYYVRKEDINKHIKDQIERARTSEREIQKKYFGNELLIQKEKYKMKMLIMEEDLRGEIASMQLRIDKADEKLKEAKDIFNNAIRTTKNNARVTSDVMHHLNHFRDELMQCCGLIEGTKDQALLNLKMIEKKEKG